MNYRPAFLLALPFVAAFVLVVFVLVVAPPASAATLEVFPPPLPLDELPPTGHDTVLPFGVEVEARLLLAVSVVSLMLALVLIPRARRALREERAAREEADRG